MSKTFNVGQLRRALTAANASWKVIEGLSDADAVPVHPLGGSPLKLQLAAQTPKLDLQKLLGVNSSNPFLNQRRVALQLLPASQEMWRFTPQVAPALESSPRLPINVLHKPGVPQVPQAPSGAAGMATPPAGGGGRAAAVDWRDRFGTAWITTVQDQGGCESCWAFAAAALVESMVRIEHAVWSKRSEGDIHDGQGKRCGDGFNLDDTIQWIQQNGVADPDCVPYRQDNPAYHPTADRSGRTVRVPDHHWIGDIEQQKIWLDTVGPLATWMDVWADFDGYGGGVYHKVATLPDGTPNYERGGHFVLVVGYDDHQGCWICKNSWGTNWGEADWRGQRGYVRIRYGEVGIDQYSKLAVQHSNPDPWTKRRLHNGNLYESGDGALHRNFEALVTEQNQVRHLWREGSDLSWHRASLLGANDAAACPTLTGTTFNRNFECVYLTTTGRMHHYWLDQTNNTWHDGGVFGPTDTAGIPGFIQGNYGAPGNFEVVVRTHDGRLAHWWRTAGGAWSESVRFGANVAYSGPSLVQTNYGKQGNLEVVAVRTDGRMQHFWRDNDHGMVWRNGDVFGGGVGSPPCMIQGQYGAGDEKDIGNFELCVAVGGQIQHWWRDNQGGTGWHMSTTFGSNVLAVAGLLEGSFGFNLELLALRYDQRVQHFWRDGAGWHAGPIL